MADLLNVGVVNGIPASGTGDVATINALMTLLSTLVGEVQATPTLNTILDRLKRIEDILGVDESTLFGTVDAVVTRPGFPGGVIPRLYDLQEGMRTPARVPEVILTPYTSGAIASGGLLVDTQEVAIAFRINQGLNENHSFTILDEANQRIAMDVLFMDNNASLGTEGSAIALAAGATARGLIWKHSVGASDWIALGSVGFAAIPNVGAVLQAAASTSSFWVAIVARAAGTFTANSLRMKFGQLNYQ